MFLFLIDISLRTWPIQLTLFDLQMWRYFWHMECAHELSKFIAIVQKYWMPYQLPQNRERVFLSFLCVGHLTLHLLQQLILAFYAWVIHITRPSTINFTFFVCGSSDFKPPSTVNFIHFTFHFTVTFHSVFHLGKFLVSKPCLCQNWRPDHLICSSSYVSPLAQTQVGVWHACVILLNNTHNPGSEMNQIWTTWVGHCNLQATLSLKYFSR